MAQRSPGVSADLSLTWLLYPLAVETFLGEIWGASHYHVSRRSPDYLAALRDGAGNVDELLGVYRPNLTLVSLVRRAEHKDRYVYRRADGEFDVAAIGRDFADGFTIVLDSVQRYVRSIAALAHSIEVELNFATQVNAYFTPPESQGFVPHFDDHDALIVQLEGSKIWHLYEGIDVPPREMTADKSIAATDLPTPVDIRLEAGEVLYVPRGRVHAAEATSELSVHLTVGLHAPTLFVLANRMLNALNNSDDEVHTRLPPRFLSDPEVRSGLSSLARRLAGTFEQPGVIAAGLSSLEADLLRRGQCQPLGAAISHAVGIDDATRVVKYQPLYARVTDNADGVTLHFAQSAVDAPADHRDALRYLVKSVSPFAISEIPGLTPAQRVELARTLIMQGFLLRHTDS